MSEASDAIAARRRFLAVATDVAESAGERLVSRFGRLGPAAIGFKGRRDIVTEADLESERLIVSNLRGTFPDHLVLAEEELSGGAAAVVLHVPQDEAEPVVDGASTGVSLAERVAAAPRCWVIDPLDGTTNYAHAHPFYAVSIAMLEHGTPTVAVVFAPSLGERFTATAGGGAERNGEPIRIATCERIGDAIFATGFPYRRHQLSNLENNVEHLNRFILDVRGFRRCGSAAIDLAYVAAGRYAFYFEAQLAPWDVAAGALLVRESGGRVTDYENGDDWLFGRRILATNGVLHEAVRERLADGWTPS